MSGWILVIGVSALISLPNGGTIRETTTLETRTFELEDACNRTGEVTKLNLFAKHHGKAQSIGAKVESLDLEHHCIPAEEAS